MGFGAKGHNASSGAVTHTVTGFDAALDGLLDPFAYLCQRE